VNQKNSMETWGILLAAGRGRRMGGGKQLLPWPALNPFSTLVAASFDALKPHVSRVLVVLGHRADEVNAVLSPREYQCVRVDPDAEMIESIRAGLRFLESIPAVAMAALHPSDHPTIRSATMSRLLTVQAAFSGTAVMPEHDGRGGHPVLIPRSLWKSIMEFCGEGGLRQLWRDHPSLGVRVPVNDPTVIADMDMPSDYWTS